MKLKQPRQQSRYHEARVRLVISLLLVVATAVAYSRIVGLGYTTFDDPDYVTKNHHVSSGLNLRGVLWAFTTGYAANWHPLTWLSHMLDVQVFGKNPLGPHIINLTLHIVNSLLLFWLLVRTTGKNWHSGLAAAFFALHPAHVESVAWIAERKDVLSALFWMLTCHAYIWFTQRPRYRRYIVVAILYAAGLMAKPMLVTLPLVLLMLDWWPLDRINSGKQHFAFGKLICEKIPLLLLALASSIVTFLAQQKGGAVQGLDLYKPGVRAANAVVAYWAYIGKLLWPKDLAALYPHPGDTLAPSVVLISGVMLLAVTVIAVILRRSRPYLATGWLWYVVTLVPVIGLVQVGRQAMADRYMYIPSIGLFIIAVWGIAELIPPVVGNKRARDVILSAVSFIVLSVFAALTWIQVGYWKDGVTLFRHALIATKGNPVVRYNLADALFKQQGNVSEAVKELRETLKTKPDLLEANVVLGYILFTQGDTSQAEELLKKAVSISPQNEVAQNNLGMVLMKQGRFGDAADRFKHALENRPDYPEAECNLGTALLRLGNVDQAGIHFRKAVELNPDSPEARLGLAIICYSQGRMQEAWRHLRLAEKHGIHPDARLLRQFSTAMPEPKD